MAEKPPTHGFHRALLACLILATGALPSEAAARELPATVIRVDPGRSATADLVVPTLAEAVALVPVTRARSPVHRAVIIEIASGIHRLDQAVRIDRVTGGRPGAPLIIRGAKGGARLTGGVPLQRVWNSLPSAPDSALPDGIVSYRLPSSLAAASSVDVRRIHSKPAAPIGLELFDAEGSLTPARWPNSGWGMTKLSADTLSRPVIETDPVQTEGWRREPDLWVAGYFGEDWSFETAPAFVAGPGRLSLAADPLYRMRDGARYYISHALSELDAPGEWWRDSTSGLVHIIPRRPGDVIEASFAEGLLDIDDASDVLIENLTFEYSRGDAIRVTGGSNIVIERCIIRWVGGRAVVFEESTHSGVRQSVITDAGEGGVRLNGGDRRTLTRSGLFVRDNIIKRFARLGRTYKFAVEMDGVGGKVVGNLIAEAPHTAIRFQGNDHEISLNEITDVATETSDTGAIYTGRDIATQGNVVRDNFIHDVRPAPGFEVKGVYLDDMASGTLVKGNLFVRVDQPVFIGGGRDNTVLSNIFAWSSPALHIDGRGITWPGPSIESADNEVHIALREVPTQSPLWRARYPRLASLMRDNPRAPKRNIMRKNILIGSDLLHMDQGADMHLQTIEKNHKVEVLKLGATMHALALGARRPIDFTPLLKTLRSSGYDAMPLHRMDRAAILARMGVGE